MLSRVLSALAIVGLLSVGCGDISSAEDDMDNVQAKAPLLPPGLLVKDSINAGEGDTIDWRDFTVFVDSHVVVTYTVGGMGEPHDVVGDITCYDMKSRELGAEPVSSERQVYDIRFDAEGKKHYFCRLQAKEGSSAYTISSETKPIIRDPCAKCGMEEKCVDGRCIDKNACYPECKHDKVCKQGICECPGGQRWSSRQSRCYTPSSRPRPKPKAVSLECSPCRQGMTCDHKTGECVPIPKPSGKGAKVLSSVPAADGVGAILTVNRGARHDIKKGQTGQLSNGAHIKVIEVFPFRCRVRTKLPASSIKPQMRVSF